MIKVYTDAAVNGNPGDVGLGILVLKDGEQKPFKIPLEEKMDNHLAEFTAIHWALEWLLEEGMQEELIFMHTDSKVAADAIAKNYTKKSYQTQSIKSWYLAQMMSIKWGLARVCVRDLMRLWSILRINLTLIWKQI